MRVGRRRRSAIAWAVLAGVAAVLVVIVALAVASLRAAGHGSPAPSAAQAVSGYAAAIHALQQEAGQLVGEEVRPSLAVLEAHKVTPATFRSEAAGWRAQLEAIRVRWDRIGPPGILAHAAHLYDLAMRQYEAAVDAFAAASRQPPAGLNAAITAAVPTAERADRTYDQADALVNSVATGLGITPPEPPGPSGS